MAEQLDPRLESRLRTALRAEADGVPFTVRVDVLEQRLTARHRAQSRRRMALVAAAVIIGVGVVGGLLSIGRLNAPVAASPSPSTTPGLETPPSFGHSDPAVPCGTPDMAAKAPPMSALYQDGVSRHGSSVLRHLEFDRV